MARTLGSGQGEIWAGGLAREQRRQLVRLTARNLDELATTNDVHMPPGVVVIDKPGRPGLLIGRNPRADQHLLIRNS